MPHLTLIDFTLRRVFNPRMLQPGGVVAPGSYTRTRRNTPLSPGLLDRMEFTARTMREKCAKKDKCLPARLTPKAVGQPVPGKPGYVYVECTEEERRKRLEDARKCAIDNISTRGGIYTRIPPS